MRISTIIFDLNGTILEDEDEYARAFGEVLKNLGVEPSKTVAHKKGVGVKENWDNLVRKYSINTDKNSYILADETQKAYLRQIKGVTIREGFSEFVENLKNSGIKIALATSNTWEQTDKILEATNLQDIFDSITTADEVVYSKPDPDIFILAAEKLGSETEECLVIEDSAAGVEAAHRAGMKVIGIALTEEDSNLLSDADFLVEGFSEITPKAIDRL